MRALATTHNGYIGSVLVPVLKRAGHEIFEDSATKRIFSVRNPAWPGLRA